MKELSPIWECSVKAHQKVMYNVGIGILVDGYSGSYMRTVNDAYAICDTTFDYSLPNFGGNIIKIGFLSPKRVFINHDSFSLMLCECINYNIYCRKEKRLRTNIDRIIPDGAKNYFDI